MEHGLEWKGIAYTEDQFALGKQLLDEIKSFLHKPVTEDNFKQTYEHCYRFLSGFPLPLIYIGDKFLVRARENINGEIFSCQEDISYNSRRPDLIQLGRFNRSIEPIFYGALPTAGDGATFVLTSMLESCKGLTDQTNTESEFRFTVGKWAIKPFIAICLCFDDKHLRTHERMKAHIDMHRQFIKDRCSEKDAAFIFSTLQFFSDLSSVKCEDPSTYMVLTALFCAIRMVYLQDNTEVNGIVYPSSITESKGLNIALTTAAVDQYLNLTDVLMYKVKRRPEGKLEMDAFPISEISPVVERKFNLEIDETRFEIKESEYR